MVIFDFVFAVLGVIWLISFVNMVKIIRNQGFEEGAIFAYARTMILAVALVIVAALKL